MSTTADFLRGNEKYIATFGDKGALAIKPSKNIIIITRKDGRVIPKTFLGLKEGDAAIIQNAGGVAVDAIPGIVIAQRLTATTEIALIHHTDCGMMRFTTPKLRDVVKASAPDDEAVARAVDEIEFHEFKDPEEHLRGDVAWLKAHPLLLKGSTVTRWMYDVETGKVRQVI